MITRVLAVDPGGTTGVAVGLFQGPLRSAVGYELPTLKALDYIYDYVVGTESVDLIVCESFTPRPGAKTWQPAALESIGVLRWLARKYSIPFELQSPANAKKFATNDKLAKLDWRKPTAGGHMDDAMRHLLLAAVKHGYVDAAVFL